MFFVLSKIIYFIVRPSDVVLLLLVAGLAAVLAGWRRRGAAVLAAGTVLFAICGWSLVPLWLMQELEGRFPRPDLSAAPYAGTQIDGILVLGGGTVSSLDKVLGFPVLYPVAERFTEAAKLAQLYPQARVVFSGGSGAVSPDDPPEAPYAARILQELGVGPGRITLEDKSRNTIENARFSYAIVKPQAGQHWILVTSAFHMPRSAGIFRQIGWPGLIPFPVGNRTEPVPHWRADHSPGEWIDIMDTAVKEYIGLVAYRLAGYTGALFPAP